MDKAVDVVASMSRKVQVLEGEIRGKVDNQDFEAVRLDAEIVREKARELNGLLSRIDYLEKSTVEQGGRLNFVEEVAVKNEDRTVLINEGLKGKAGGVDFENLKAMVESIRMVVTNDKADRKDLTRVETVVGGQGEALESLNAALHSVALTQEGTREAVADLERGTATKGELRRVEGNATTRGMLSEAMARVQAAMEGKAGKREFQKLKREVGEARSKLEVTGRKAELAGEFVEWYSRKGEALEGNLLAVDKHLERLAVKGKAEVLR